jgi:hypothetical protein
MCAVARAALAMGLSILFAVRVEFFCQEFRHLAQGLIAFVPGKLIFAIFWLLTVL